MPAAGIVDANLRDLCFSYDCDSAFGAVNTPLPPESGVHVQHVEFSSTHGRRVTGLVWIPDRGAGPFPLIVLQHGARGRKESDYIRLPALGWCRAGFACVAIDANEHGERLPAAGDRQDAIWSEPWQRKDHAVQMCVDLQRTLDFLALHGAIDVERTGFFGVSMGAINGVAFAARDQRVKAAAFMVGGSGLYGLRGSADEPFRNPDMEIVAALVDPVHFAPLVAPRPVLMVNGRRDGDVPSWSASALFAALGEPKAQLWFEGGHDAWGGPELQAVWSFLRANV